MFLHKILLLLILETISDEALSTLGNSCNEGYRVYLWSLKYAATLPEQL